MIIRKVKEISSLGKLMSVFRVGLDTNKINIDQNKRIEAKKENRGNKYSSERIDIRGR